MKFIKLTTILVLLTIFVSLTQDSSKAQEDPRACSDTVQTALEAAKRLCTGIGRHRACYGNLLVNAEPQNDTSPFKFDEPGDIVEVASLKSLRLSPFDPQENIWGIAQLYLQADIPSSQPQNVTVILFGDVQVENAVPPVTVIEITVDGQDEVPILAQPWPIAETLGFATPNQQLTATGRTSDSAWLRVESLDGTVRGWIPASYVGDVVDIAPLTVTDGETPYQTPMQAFYLQSGTNDYECSDIPSDGLLIQTPEGVAQVTLLINEVNIELGSTAFVQARPNETMQITMLEGKAKVSAGGMIYEVPAGQKIEIPMTADLRPADVPNEPTAYEPQDVAALPIDLLTESIEIAPPAETEEPSEEKDKKDKENNGDNGNHGTGNNGNNDNANNGNPPNNPNSNPPNSVPNNGNNGNNGNGNGNNQAANGNQSNSAPTNNGNNQNNGNNGNGNNANNNPVTEPTAETNNQNNGNGNNANNGNGNNGNGNNANNNSVTQPTPETSNQNNGNNGNGNNGNGNNGNGNNSNNGNNGNGNGSTNDEVGEQEGMSFAATPMAVGGALVFTSLIMVVRRRK